MSKHSDRAVELFKSGYNCSQAVFAAFVIKQGFPRKPRFALRRDLAAASAECAKFAAPFAARQCLRVWCTARQTAKTAKRKPSPIKRCRKLSRFLSKPTTPLSAGSFWGFRKRTNTLYRRREPKSIIKTPLCADC